MSNNINQAILEDLYEDGLEQGLSEEEAAKYAMKKFEEIGALEKNYE
jgi:pyrroline-5-carboxylate reductase|tara:strand:- start:124 stop:264 length:141 start_codon:yes stop_codon:yes gene_type:complete